MSHFELDPFQAFSEGTAQEGSTMVNGMREDSSFDKANSEIASTHVIIHC